MAIYPQSRLSMDSSSFDALNRSFSAFSHVVTKHVLGSQDEFNQLKERLEMCEHATSKAGAAALGYLIAMEEKEEKAPRGIYDYVLQQVENTEGNACHRTNIIFSLIREWLETELEKEDFQISVPLRCCILPRMFADKKK